MGKKLKKGTGIYAYLDCLGILTNGSDDDIKRSKKKYWSEYRKQWKKNKRQESKSFRVLFNFKEARMIADRAGKSGLSPTSFIKQAALNTKQRVIAAATIGEIRQLLAVHYNVLQSITEENILSQELGERLQQQALQIEKTILATLNPT